MPELPPVEGVPRRQLKMTYFSKFTKELSPGQSICVKGFLRGPSFDIGLHCGPNVAGLERDDAALVIKGRLATSEDETLEDRPTTSLSSLVHEEWTTEEIQDLGLRPKQEFSIRIRMREDCFELWTQQTKAVDFQYKVPLQSVQHIYIVGEIDLYRCDWEGRYYPDPFCCYLPPGALGIGCTLYVAGFLEPDADRFEVDIKSKKEFVLHLNARLKKKTLTRMHTMDGEWAEGDEDATKDIPHLPLEPGKAFEMLVHVADDAFLVYMNGQYICDYKRRYPVESIDNLVIEGQVDVHAMSWTSEEKEAAKADKSGEIPDESAATTAKDAAVNGMDVVSEVADTVDTSAISTAEPIESQEPQATNNLATDVYQARTLQREHDELAGNIADDDPEFVEAMEDTTPASEDNDWGLQAQTDQIARRQRGDTQQDNNNQHEGMGNREQRSSFPAEDGDAEFAEAVDYSPATPEWQNGYLRSEADQYTSPQYDAVQRNDNEEENESIHGHWNSAVEDSSLAFRTQSDNQLMKSEHLENQPMKSEHLENQPMNAAHLENQPMKTDQLATMQEGDILKAINSSLGETNAWQGESNRGHRKSTEADSFVEAMNVANAANHVSQGGLGYDEEDSY